MNEDKIIQFYIENNDLNIKQIVLDYTNYVYKIIINMSKEILTNEDIEEIISDVFFAIWKNEIKLDKNALLKPYIAGVARNIIKNKLRNVKVTEEITEMYRDNLEIDDVIEGREEYEIISNEINKLGEDGKIFMLYYYKGMRAKEIANRMNLTEFNIHTKLHRIKKKLKIVLSERGYNYGK